MADREIQHTYEVYDADTGEGIASYDTEREAQEGAREYREIGINAKVRQEK